MTTSAQAPGRDDTLTGTLDDDELESLMDEVASILETEDDLELTDEKLHDLQRGRQDLGEQYFDIRDGPVFIEPRQTKEIVLVDDPESGTHVLPQEMLRRVEGPAEPVHDVVSLDPDDPVLPDEESVENSEEIYSRGWFSRILDRFSN
jgi:hypothetical protein